MAEVTYLLGAGASANCIPTVNGIGKSIEELKKNLKKEENINILYNILDNIKKICAEYSSIDTHAKRLFLTRETKVGNDVGYEDLKRDLTAYFTIVQLIENPDKRYNNFFASILSKQNELPPKIKILSWNYDYQIEKSYRNFCSHADQAFNNVRERLNTTKLSKDHFCFYKLNGSAVFDDVDQFAIQLNPYSQPNIYPLLQEKRKNNMKFAWEDDESFNQNIQCFNKTEVLVIIGYTFPFFNREKDLQIFKTFQKLEKIYIQDIEPEKIQETLMELLGKTHPKKKIPIILKENVNQFVFPQELDISV